MQHDGMSYNVFKKRFYNKYIVMNNEKEDHSKIGKYIYAKPFSSLVSVAFALLLILGSCQSNDHAGVGEGASVASLPLTAQIGEASSRVSMSDTYGGAFSCSWNSDQLSIYHSYVLSGAVQSIKSLAFATTTTSGTSATFSCAGAGAYRYNPGLRLYAFSSGTSGNYTATVIADGTSTLKATTLASQNGTLSDCAKYDALYGSANVNYTTGLPETLSMHHLFGMMNLHLTSSTFSTSYPVTVTLTSSASNILPGNSGNATLKADGTLNVLTGSWGKNWSGTVTPTKNGEVDVYFMTWPFSAISGTLTVLCSDNTSYNYTSRTVTLSSFSLAAAQVKSKPLAITNASADATYSKLYAWDATDSQPVSVNTAPTNANVTTLSSISTDYSSRALYACKNCPNAYEITWYLSVDCYWDNGNVSGGNTTSYKMLDGSTTKAGMWFRKKSGITGFSSSNAYSTSLPLSRIPITLTSTLAFSLNLNSDYFFLPAIGYTTYNNGSFSTGGTYGHYWSSTPDVSNTTAYNLRFYSTEVALYSSYRTTGMSLWQGQ